MANSFPELEAGFPTSPSSATDPRPPSRWWTQSQSLFLRRKELAKEEHSATSKPYMLGYFTTCAVFIIGSFYKDRLSCQASFSVESILVFPSFAVWHVDLLVKNPSSTCPIYYDGDDVYAKLGPVNAAVLKTSHTRRSGGYTSFSVDLATGSNQSNVVAASPKVFELDIKISAKKKRSILGYQSGHFDVRCQNLIIGHEKIKCHSSFKESKLCCYEIEE